MADAKRDQNQIVTLMGVTDDGNLTPVNLVVDPVTGRLKVSAVIAVGTITSLNGLSAAVQTLVVGTGGNDFNISSVTDVHTFNLPTASATKRGALSSADWSTFNGKQNALGYTPENSANKAQNNGYASLDSNGKVPTAQLPALSLTDVFTAASEAAQLALTAEEGDMVIRTDTNKSYVHNGGVAGTMADYTEITTAAETAATIGNIVSGAADATPNNTDVVATAESGVIKKITWTNVKAFLKTYFDTLYSLVGKLVLTEAPGNQSYTGITVSLTAGETLAAGDIVYFKSDGKVWKADANAASTYPAMGLATASITANNAGVILLSGIYRDDTLYNFTVGGVVYLSTTAGAATQTQPSATDDAIQVLGIATHADRIFFSPSRDYMTHV